MLARWVMVGLTEADWPSRYLGRGIEARGLPGPSTCLVPLGEAAGLLCIAGSFVPRPLGWFEGQATLVNNPRRENGWEGGSRPSSLLGKSYLLSAQLWCYFLFLQQDASATRQQQQRQK